MAKEMKKVKPSYWICGGGGNINCSEWDDVNGCWADQDDVCTCQIRLKIKEAERESEKEI